MGANVRVARDEALLLHNPDDLKFVLGGSPDPFASDPEPKRNGMAAFQPDALKISRNPVWEDRRRFAEAVLDTGKPMHRLAQPFTDAARDTAEELARRQMTWQTFNDAFQKMTRRIVFGDKAAGNTSLTELLGELMISMIEGYLKDPDPDSLAGLVAEAPAPGSVTPAGQMVHWLFAMGDTLAANTFRALGALSTHTEQQREVRAEMGGADITSAIGIASLKYLAGCLLEAMRLWPTTTLFGRVATRDVEFPNGAVLPEGTPQLPQPRPTTLPRRRAVGVPRTDGAGSPPGYRDARSVRHALGPDETAAAQP